MTSYIPNYENDIFVSYADLNERWTSDLVKGLRVVIAQRLGGHDIFSLYIPEATRKIRDSDRMIKKSALFLLISSSEYLQSEQCLNEKQRIFNEIQDDSSRLVVIEKDQNTVKQLNLPDKTTTYQFPAETEPKETNYYQEFYKVADRLEQELTIRRAQASSNQQEKPEEQGAVFIDAAPQDLDSAGEIKKFLEGERIHCKPSINFDVIPADIRRQLDSNLLSCNNIIIFFETVPNLWVEEHVKYYKRVLSRRNQDKPIKNLIVFHRSDRKESPPNLPENLPNIKTIRQSSEQKELLLLLKE